MDFKDSRLLAPPAPVNFTSVERQTPTFVMQAVGAAIGLSLGTGVVVFFAVLAFAVGVNWKPAWRPAASISGLVTLGVMLYWALQGAENVMWQTETITGHDLNRDGVIGAPQKPTISVEISEPVYNRYAQFDLPGTPEAFGKLMRGVLIGKPISEAAWTGRGKPYSKAEFSGLCDELDARGITRWRNDKAKSQGRELTRAGRAVFEAMAEAPEIARTHDHASNGGPLLPPGEEE